MKILGYFSVFILLCGLSGTAKAFQFSIQDPDIGSFEVFANTPFSFSFGACELSEIPVGEAGGCFYAVNASGDPLTSLTASFPNTATLGSQAATCNTNISSGSEFSAAPACGLDPSDTTTYELLFDGPPGIPTAGFFTFVETGFSPGDFPEVTADAAGPGASAVPEPASIALLSSGTVILGGLLFRRKQGVFSPLA